MSTTKFVLVGDLNIDLFKNENNIKKFKKLIEEAVLRQIAKDATRITNKSATLIDHIITCNYTVNELSRHFPAISDHEYIGVEISFIEISYQATNKFNRILSVEVSEISNELELTGTIPRLM